MGSTSTGCSKGTIAAIIACFSVGAGTAAGAAETMRCVSVEESAAFRLRHLQSRLMVAALGCNQQATYNAFVERFRPELVTAGGHLSAYFQRSGGPTALNKHVTDLANAAGLARAEDPNGYCKQAWQLFWSLEQDPQALARFAAANALTTIVRPTQCSETAGNQVGAAPESETAALGNARAAESPDK